MLNIGQNPRKINDSWGETLFGDHYQPALTRRDSQVSIRAGFFLPSAPDSSSGVYPGGWDGFSPLPRPGRLSLFMGASMSHWIFFGIANVLFSISLWCCRQIERGGE